MPLPRHHLFVKSKRLTDSLSHSSFIPPVHHCRFLVRKYIFQGREYSKLRVGDLPPLGGIEKSLVLGQLMPHDQHTLCGVCLKSSDHGTTFLPFIGAMTFWQYRLHRYNYQATTNSWSLHKITYLFQAGDHLFHVRDLTRIWFKWKVHLNTRCRNEWHFTYRIQTQENVNQPTGILSIQLQMLIIP